MSWTRFEWVASLFMGSGLRTRLGVPSPAKPIRNMVRLPLLAAK
jgi:hypothetical protein